jgi:hypothetical protein
MLVAIRKTVTVEQGGVVRVTSSELQPGTSVEVIVLFEPAAQAVAPTLSSLIGRGKGSFSSVEEVDRFIRSERDEWDR